MQYYFSKRSDLLLILIAMLTISHQSFKVVNIQLAVFQNSINIRSK
jgi:hypothetical protein